MKITEEQDLIATSTAKTLVVTPTRVPAKPHRFSNGHGAGHTSFIYLAYNKSVQMMAKDLFPPNVKCVTTHGLAYDDIVPKTELRLDIPPDSLHDAVMKMPFFSSPTQLQQSLHGQKSIHCRNGSGVSSKHGCDHRLCPSGDRAEGGTRPA